MPTGKQKIKKSLAIIGANLQGAALFYFATKYGSFDEILLIDKKEANDILKDDQLSPFHAPIWSYNNKQLVNDIYENKKIAAILALNQNINPFKNKESILLASKPNEVSQLTNNYQNLLSECPDLSLWDAKSLSKHEPEMLRGRYITKDSIAAIFHSDQQGFINLAKVINLLIDSALRHSQKAKVLFNHDVLTITEENNQLLLHSFDQNIKVDNCVYFAKETALHCAQFYTQGKDLTFHPLWLNFLSCEKLTHRNIYLLSQYSPFYHETIKVTNHKQNLINAGYSLKENQSKSPSLIRGLLNKQSTLRSFLPQIKSLAEKESLINNSYFNTSSIRTFFSHKKVKNIFPSCAFKILTTPITQESQKILIDKKNQNVISNMAKFNIDNKLIFNITTKNSEGFSFTNAINDLELLSQAHELIVDYESLYRDLQ